MPTRIGNAIWVLENLPELLHKKRTEAGLSYRQLGEQIGASYTHLWYIEQGTKNPGLETIIAVLRWLDS